MAKRKFSPADVDEDGVLFEMPHPSVDDTDDDTEELFDDTAYVSQSCHADAFNLPVDAPSLSLVLSKERQGLIMIRDKQVFPCPKEGCVQVYVEYIDLSL